MNLSRRIVASRGQLSLPTLLRWQNSWKTELLRQAFKIESGEFIDIGANIGQTLLDFYAVAGTKRYIGFEPNPASFVSLFHLVKQNEFENSLILPIGLSSATRLINLYTLIGDPTDACASILPNLRLWRSHNQRPVPVLCCRFDDLREDLGITSIGLIKIDVEGAELAVLQGMEKSLREFRPPILCEILYADPTTDIMIHEERVRSLAEFIAGIEYDMYRVRIDNAGTKFYGLVQIPEFPVRVIFTQENAHECDYMLIPTERTNDYAMLLFR
jgi:FkbM family methyltransferase